MLKNVLLCYYILLLHTVYHPLFFIENLNCNIFAPKTFKGNCQVKLYSQNVYINGLNLIKLALGESMLHLNWKNQFFFQIKNRKRTINLSEKVNFHVDLFCIQPVQLTFWTKIDLRLTINFFRRFSASCHISLQV